MAICSAVNMVDWVGAELGGEGRGGKGDNCNNATITITRKEDVTSVGLLHHCRGPQLRSVPVLQQEGIALRIVRVMGLRMWCSI